MKIRTVVARLALVGLGFAMAWSWFAMDAFVRTPRPQRPAMTPVATGGCPAGYVQLTDPATRCQVCVTEGLVYPACRPPKSPYEAQPATAGGGARLR